MATGQYIGVNGVARKVTAPYIGVEGVARNVISGYVGVNGVARLFFAPESGNVVLEVEKITSDTYANNTTYTAEEFILLDIYPKTGGRVKVTYGGLTKTITDTSGAEEPNAQQVYFGTFNGVTDSVTTPASGTLTIEGDISTFAVGQYKMYSSKSSLGAAVYCNCITAVSDFGDVETLPSYAFYGCTGLTSINIPSGVTRIESYAFYGCTGLTSINIPSGVTRIESYAFYGCTGLTSINIPSGVTRIESYAFYECKGLTSVVVPNGVTDIGNSVFRKCSNLANLTLPSTLKTIGDAVAHKLLAASDVAITVRVLATTPPTYTGTSDTMQLVQEATARDAIIVPKGCLDAYKTAAGWSTYADHEYVSMTEAS